MAFCSSLRRRASCSGLVQVILSSREPVIRENSLQTHDIAVPFSCRGQNHVFRALILTETSVASSNLAQTMSRVQHFASLNGGILSAIFFLAPPKVVAKQRDPSVEAAAANPHPLQSLQNLQVALHSANISILCLYLETPNVLPEMLNELTTSPPELSHMMPEVPCAGTDLLPYCITDGPMDQATFTAVSDVCPNIRDLASLEDKSVSLEGMVNAGLEEKKMKACVSYWSEEWVAE